MQWNSILAISKHIINKTHATDISKSQNEPWFLWFLIQLTSVKIAPIFQQNNTSSLLLSLSLLLSFLLLLLLLLLLSFLFKVSLQ